MKRQFSKGQEFSTGSHLYDRERVSGILRNGDLVAMSVGVNKRRVFEVKEADGLVFGQPGYRLVDGKQTVEKLHGILAFFKLRPSLNDVSTATSVRRMSTNASVQQGVQRPRTALENAVGDSRLQTAAIEAAQLTRTQDADAAKTAVFAAMDAAVYKLGELDAAMQEIAAGAQAAAKDTAEQAMKYAETMARGTAQVKRLAAASGAILAEGQDRLPFRLVLDQGPAAAAGLEFVAQLRAQMQAAAQATRVATKCAEGLAAMAELASDAHTKALLAKTPAVVVLATGTKRPAEATAAVIDAMLSEVSEDPAVKAARDVGSKLDELSRAAKEMETLRDAERRAVRLPPHVAAALAAASEATAGWFAAARAAAERDGVCRRPEASGGPGARRRVEGSGPVPALRV